MLLTAFVHQTEDTRGIGGKNLGEVLLICFYPHPGGRRKFFSGKRIKKGGGTNIKDTVILHDHVRKRKKKKGRQKRTLDGHGGFAQENMGKKR